MSVQFSFWYTLSNFDRYIVKSYQLFYSNFPHYLLYTRLRYSKIIYMSLDKVCHLSYVSIWIFIIVYENNSSTILWSHHQCTFIITFDALILHEALLFLFLASANFYILFLHVLSLVSCINCGMH